MLNKGLPSGGSFSFIGIRTPSSAYTTNINRKGADGMSKAKTEKVFVISEWMGTINHNPKTRVKPSMGKVKVKKQGGSK